MKLRLVANTSPLVIQEETLRGAIQAEITMSKIAKIEGLKRRELGEIITYLKGNKLCEEVEIRNCEFDANNLVKLNATLSTLPNLKGLTSLSLSDEDNQALNNTLQTLNKIKICKLEMSVVFNPYQKKPDTSLLGTRIKEFTPLLTLHLNFKSYAIVEDFKSVIEFCSDVLRHLNSLTALRLDFQKLNTITELWLRSALKDSDT